MPKLSGLALCATMVLLRLCVLHWNLGGEFFRLHLVSEKISVIGAQKGRNEGKGVLVQPCAVLCRLRTLQVCLVAVAAVAAVFAFLGVKFVAAAMAAVVAAAFCYLCVVTTACGFTSGAHITLGSWCSSSLFLLDSAGPSHVFHGLVFWSLVQVGLFWAFGSRVVTSRWCHNLQKLRPLLRPLAPRGLWVLRCFQRGLLVRLPQPRHHGWTWRRPRTQQQQQQLRPIILLASSGHVWTEFRGLPGPGEKFQRVEEEGMHGGGKLEKLDSFFVFVVSLGGSSVQVRVEGSDSYESLAAKVAAKVNIPECHWYLTFSGKDLRHVLRPTSVLHCDSTIRMCSRLLGGAPLQPTPGEWFCPACNRGGCLLSLLGTATSWRLHSASASVTGAQSKGKACFGERAFAQSQSVPH